MAAGLFACFYTTCCNLFFFSTVLVNFDYEIDQSLLESNKEVPMVIIGFGTVISVVFLFIAMIKTIGNGIIILIDFQMTTISLLITRCMSEHCIIVRTAVPDDQGAGL